MFSFDGKVVWITGASSGIGKALTYELAQKGCKLILSSRREDELEKIKTDCGLPKEDVLVLPFDLTDIKVHKEKTAKVIQHFGRIDVLINNGGISQRSFAKDTSLEIDRKIFETNYFSAISITKSVLPYMISQNSGYIIVTSSVSGKFGFYLRTTYAATKHALHGFFESLRFELLANNIKVTLVCPGKIKTNISMNAINEKGEKHNKMDASTENGISADICAKKIISGIEKEKEEILIGGKEILPVYIKRFFPRLFTSILKNQKVE